jgi:serine-type D-Ala-D-Ala carboxypeptidase/endopeptidase (penicillin-binding protein 4)
MHRGFATTLAALSLLTLFAVPARAGGAWRQKIDSAIGGHSVSVEVRAHGALLYSHAATQTRAPASNMKLILSMALLHRFGANFCIPTFAEARSHGAVIPGDLWIMGRGDPSFGESGHFPTPLPFAATRVGRLARKIKASGVTTIRGSVMGSTGYFHHDWYAPGWKPDFPIDEVALPSALTFDANVASGHHIGDPELRAAAALTAKLRKIGVAVKGPAGAGIAPPGVTPFAHVTARPLWKLLRYMDRSSSNFFAEVLGKRLAVERFGGPGTIPKAARAISSWAASHGVTVTAYDSSGLSYYDRVTARGIVKLLGVANRNRWGRKLRHALPKGDQGTLEDRLGNIRVRAKTGTLDGISALSGWVWLQRSSRWAKFSILDNGLSKTRAAQIEDTIVRTVSRHAW